MSRRVTEESFWQGPFGDAYTERNLRISSKRTQFWEHITLIYKPATVLEVGCNYGANLRYLSQFLDPLDLWGIDVNERALTEARECTPKVNFLRASAYDLPFKDRMFSLVFTAGVLIHQHPSELPAVMGEIVRCAGSYVLAIEYADEAFVEVPYRGFSEALYRGPFGDAYRKLGLMLIETGKLGKDDGFDDCTYWVLKR